MEVYTPTGGGSPPPALNTLLDRLLDEVEGDTNAANQPSAPPPPPAVSSVPAQAVPGGTAPSGSATPSPGNTIPASGGGVSLLGGLLANPALLSALPTLAENLSPLLGSMSRGTGSAPTATRPHTVDRHTALLCAVKPYLSPRRQDAAETVIRLCRIWDALERSGISLSGLLSNLGGAAPAAQEAATEGEVT